MIRKDELLSLIQDTFANESYMEQSKAIADRCYRIGTILSRNKNNFKKFTFLNNT